MTKRTRNSDPPSSDPAKPGPGIIHSSLYLPEAFYEGSGEAAAMVDLPSTTAPTLTVPDNQVDGAGQPLTFSGFSSNGSLA
jgi:hypothetical protein